MEELEAQSCTDARAWIPIALTADALGDPNRAMDALEKAYEARVPFVDVIALEGWLPLRSIRSSQPFSTLLQRIGAQAHDVPRQRELLLAFERESAPA
jgi:hypothetical protein